MENSNLNREVRDAKTSNRGLASADPETRKTVARKGGEYSRNTPEQLGIRH